VDDVNSRHTPERPYFTNSTFSEQMSQFMRQSYAFQGAQSTLQNKQETQQAGFMDWVDWVLAPMWLCALSTGISILPLQFSWNFLYLFIHFRLNGELNVLELLL
jgi:hypothetical protein